MILFNLANASVEAHCQPFPQQATGQNDFLLDRVFVTAIQWPNKDAQRHLVDNSEAISQVLEILETDSESVYRPGYDVWKQIVIRSSRAASVDITRWKLIQRAFRGMAASHSSYCPDHVLLKLGLDACVVLHDAALASDLMCRALQEYSETPASGDNFFGEMTQQECDTTRCHVPQSDILRAIKVCVVANDMAQSDKILNSIKKLALPRVSVRWIFEEQIKGYASQGDFKAVERLIYEMGDSDIKVR
jgi:hypothetical protein